MLKLKVKIPSLDKVKILSKDQYKHILMKSMFKMEELAIEKAPFDLGGLRENITLFPEILSDNYVLSSKMPYSAPMEYGTRPFYAPIKPLKEWAKRKLGNEDLGYAVRAKIASEGIRAHPFMRPAFYEVKDFWVEQFAKEQFFE